MGRKNITLLVLMLIDRLTDSKKTRAQKSIRFGIKF
jgi:hypothetical protein